MELKNLFETPKDRQIAITDGVYAIAMTILALEIGVPAVTEITNMTQMNQYFTTTLIPQIIIYLISFYLVSSFWENSLLLFGFDEINTTVQNLNLIALALVCLIPFNTGFLFEFTNYPQPNILFAIINLIISILYLGMYIVIFKKRMKKIFKDNKTHTLNEIHTKLHEFYENTIKKEHTSSFTETVYPHFKNQFGASALTLFYLIISPIVVSIIAILVVFISPYLSVLTYIILIITRTIIKFRRNTKFNFNEINMEFTNEEQELIDRFKEYNNEK